MTRLRLAILFLLVCAMVGCSSGNSAVPGSIAGKITYKGQPVKGGTMKFFGTDGVGYDAKILPTGAYSATDIPIGELVVTVDTESLKPKDIVPKGKDADARMKMAGGGQKAPEDRIVYKPEDLYVQIPAKYGTPKTSPLKVTVSKGRNTQDFDLTD
jgi:hypothetical protein